MGELFISATHRVVQLGPDRVKVASHEIIIDAKHSFPDWDVRELNFWPIYFEGQKYYLVQQNKAPAPYAVRYLLQPWPEGYVSNTTKFCTYDAESVEQREACYRAEKGREFVRSCLLPLFPVLGFLWSGLQKRLSAYGFIPHRISGVSIFTGFCILFGEAVFSVILLNAGPRSGSLMLGGLLRAFLGPEAIHLGPIAIGIGLLDLILVVTLTADVLVRYNHYLNDPDWAGGFLEWLFARNRSR